MGIVKDKMMILQIIIFLFFSIFSIAKPPKLEKGALNNPPPRIIRTCCSFGVDVKLAVFSFVKFTETTGLDKIGPHKYLGNKEEQNGIIYTQHGGFIDLGHLRDMADFTGYLFSIIQSKKGQPNFSIKMGVEGGMKTLNLFIPEDISDGDAVQLAGKIAYDISVWHEISTWFGASFIPMVPERYSSFSVEDAYSNLLGVHLGMKALQSDLEFEEAMTSSINETLKNFGAVEDTKATNDAMNEVKDIWWSGTAKLPSRKVLIKRLFKVYDCIFPLLISNENIEIGKENQLCVPENASIGKSLNDYYSFSIKSNFKIPIKKIYGENQKGKTLTQLDFPTLIAYAEQAAHQKQ